MLDIIASHAIDQARFLCGEIVSVSGAITSIAPERTYGGSPAQPTTLSRSSRSWRAGQSPRTIDASLISPGRRNHLAWELNGAKGSLAWNLEEPNVLRVHRANSGHTGGFAQVITCEADHPLAGAWWPSGHVLGWEHAHINMLAHFCDAVANDTEVEPVRCQLPRRPPRRADRRGRPRRGRRRDEGGHRR